MHVRAQEWVVCCHSAQVHSHFLAEVLKDPGYYLLEASRLSALTQPATIVGPNVEPNLKPGDDDCLRKIVPVSPSVLQNRSCFGIAVVNHPAESIESLCDGCGCKSRCPLARSPRPLPGEPPGSVAKSQGCSGVLRRGSWQRQRWRKGLEGQEPHGRPKSRPGDPRAVLAAGQCWWWLAQTHILSCPAAQTAPQSSAARRSCWWQPQAWRRQR